MTIQRFNGQRRSHSGRVAGLSLLLATLVAGHTALAWGAAPCSRDDGLQPLCGPVNAEDLLHIPGTRWLVASGMAGEATSGHLYLVDPDGARWEEIYPGAAARNALDRNAFPDCPSALNPSAFSAHGLALHPVSAARQHLYVTSHGEREAVEVFELNVSTATPVATWIGCVPIPAHNDINSVAALADGGFLATRISGTGPEAGGDIFAGEISGFLYEWHPGGTPTRVARTEMSGPNGIVVSEDGLQVYVGSWGRAEVARFVRAADGGLRHDRTMETGFRVDNLRWTPEGTILAAGHRLSASRDCGSPLCFDEWEVAEIDPRTMTSTTLLIRKPTPEFLGATAAIRNGGDLWLGTFHGSQILHVPAALPD